MARANRKRGERAESLEVVPPDAASRGAAASSAAAAMATPSFARACGHALATPLLAPPSAQPHHHWRSSAVQRGDGGAGPVRAAARPHPARWAPGGAQEGSGCWAGRTAQHDHPECAPAEAIALAGGTGAGLARSGRALGARGGGAIGARPVDDTRLCCTQARHTAPRSGSPPCAPCRWRWPRSPTTCSPSWRSCRRRSSNPSRWGCVRARSETHTGAQPHLGCTGVRTACCRCWRLLALSTSRRSPSCLRAAAHAPATACLPCAPPAEAPRAARRGRDQQPLLPGRARARGGRVCRAGARRPGVRCAAVRARTTAKAERCASGG